MLSCNTCLLKKNKDDFPKSGRTCKECLRRQNNEKARNRTTLQRRIKSLRERYKLDYNDYLLLLEKQGNVCKICKRTLTKPYVDHDHEIGKVRGLLCNKCNLALGLFKDSPTILRNAAEYLEAV